MGGDLLFVGIDRNTGEGIDQIHEDTGMKAGERVFVIMAFMGLLWAMFSSASLHAEPQSPLVVKIRNMEKRIDQLEAEHASIIKEQEKVIKDLEGLKIWINKHR